MCENCLGQLEDLIWEEKGSEWVRYCQPSSPKVEMVSVLLLVPRDMSSCTTASCSANWHPQRHRGFGEKSRFGSDPGRCHIHWMQNTLRIRDQSLFCLSDVCQQCCGAERLRQVHAGERESLPGDTKSVQRGCPTFSFKAIQISSAMETTGFLLLPFFVLKMELRQVYICEMAALSFHLGGSCLTECIENITLL